MKFVFQCTTARGRIHIRAVHGGRALGHIPGDVSRFDPQGAVPADAGGVHQGRDPGQGRAQEHVRVPGLQNAIAWRHLRLDF